jgi:hypothetical protein
MRRDYGPPLVQNTLRRQLSGRNAGISSRHTVPTFTTIGIYPIAAPAVLFAKWPITTDGLFVFFATDSLSGLTSNYSALEKLL